MSHLRTLHVHYSVDHINDFGLSPKQFSKLTLAEQDDIVRHAMRYGDQGHENVDTDFVPPYCRDGVTLPQLQSIMDKSHSNIENRCKQLVKDQNKFGRSVNDLLHLYE